jgi:PAS domain S-box-containing protein
VDRSTSNPDDAMQAVTEMTIEEIEHRLFEIQQNYSEFFEAAHDGFYISTRAGRFLDCNDALVAMLGYRVTEEVLGLDLNTDLWLHPGDRQEFQTIIEQQGRVDDYEAVFKRKDGSPLYVGLSSRVWKGDRGRIRGYRGFVEDLTEKRTITERLTASETRYRDLFENIQDGLYISDALGKLIDCNPAFTEIVGHTKADFLAMDYYTEFFMHASAALDFRRQLTRNGVIKDYELQIRRGDGTVRDVSMSGYASRNEADEIIGYQGLIRDITETKRLYRQLLRSERLSAMGKMASQLAHELNNPIYGIMNCLELVADALPVHHPRQRYLDLAHNECKRTSILLIKMLKFFQPDNEKRSAADINKLLEETLLFYEKQFMNQNIRVITDLRPDLPLVVAVESQLKQVFINMVINANMAMPSGGELTVSSAFDASSRMVEIGIRDTGTGISPENLERIFDAFFTTKKGVLKGVGLGLTICYGFIRDHGGRIEVDSEVNKGTRFTIYLPLDSTATETTSPEATASDALGTTP